MRLKICSVLVVLASISLFAQDTITLNSIDSITQFSADAKGNLFVADDRNTLHKFDSLGAELARVNTKVYGAIHKIDCSNPFEIYTFHKAQNVVVFYDNMLNVRGVSKLNDLDFSNIANICRSYDNAIWLFNLDTYTLERVSKNGDVLAQSYNLINLVKKRIAVVDVKEWKNNVYVLDSVNGIHQFDFFGTYKTTFYLPGFSLFDFEEESIVAVNDRTVVDYDLLTRDYDIIELLVFRQFSILPNGKWYVLRKNNLLKY